MDSWLLVVGAAAVVVASMSRRIRELPLSEPLLGLAAGVLAGTQVLGLLGVGGHDVTLLGVVLPGRGWLDLGWHLTTQPETTTAETR